MSIRYLIAAALMASACGAQADVLPTTGGAQSSFLTGWTTGAGTDVLGSGVLNNASLVGGVSYGSDSNSLIQALYEKASASVGAGGEVNLSYKQGVSGTYLTGVSNAKLAAMAGNGISVINTPEGVKIVQAGSGNNQGSGAPSTASPPSTSAPSTSAPSTSAPSSTPSQSNPGHAGGSIIDTPVSLPPVVPRADDGVENGNGDGTGGNAGGTTGGAGEGGGGNTGGSGTGGNAGTGGDTGGKQGEVPEPSSIALMLAGLFGACGLRRRAR